MNINRFAMAGQSLPSIFRVAVGKNNCLARILSCVSRIQNSLQLTGLTGSRAMSSITSTTDESKVPDSAKAINDRAFINRNPRNLEMMGIAWKRKGWRFQYPSREYYHRLVFVKTNRQISGHVEHYSGVRVLTVSSTDLALARHLYSTTDTSAARSVGRLLSYMCLQAGITNLCFQPLYNNPASVKMKAFCEAMEAGGISLEERAEVEPLYTPGIDYDDTDAVSDIERRQQLVYRLSEESATNLKLKLQRHMTVRRRPWRKPEKLEMPDPSYY